LIVDGRDATLLEDTDLTFAIALIEENLAECGMQSSYAWRNKPILKEYRREARKRGLL
jgi:hypothetical protein